MNNTSLIIMFEGIDFSGKTHIAKRLAEVLNLPYFKNSQERILKKKRETLGVTRYAMPFFIELLRQVSIKIVMDRCYPSEWVYAQVEKRKWEPKVVEVIDEEFAKLETVIIVCYKTVYDNFKDEMTRFEKLPILFEKYREFAKWSKVKNIMFLDTTDNDLDVQIESIVNYLGSLGYLEKL